MVNSGNGVNLQEHFDVEFFLMRKKWKFLKFVFNCNTTLGKIENCVFNRWKKLLNDFFLLKMIKFKFKSFDVSMECMMSEK